MVPHGRRSHRNSLRPLNPCAVVRPATARKRQSRVKMSGNEKKSEGGQKEGRKVASPPQRSNRATEIKESSHPTCQLHFSLTFCPSFLLFRLLSALFPCFLIFRFSWLSLFVSTSTLLLSLPLCRGVVGVQFIKILRQNGQMYIYMGTVQA